MSPAPDTGLGPAMDPARDPALDPEVVRLAAAEVARAAEVAARRGRDVGRAAQEVCDVRAFLEREWQGHAGAAAVAGADALHERLDALATDLLYICDVLRVEGAAIGRAVTVAEGTAAAEALLHRLDLAAADPLTPGGSGTDRSTPPQGLGLAPSSPPSAPWPPPSDPRAVPAWWHSLGPGQRDRLRAEHPGELADLDGLPALERDRLNRAELHEGLDVPVAPAALSGLSGYLSGSPDALLLDLDGPGRAVVADRDPDTAGRVVTFVPGTGSSPASTEDNADRATNLCTAATTADGETAAPHLPDDPATDATVAPCAAVTWMDYDAPPEVPAAAVEPGRAEDAAPRLRAFQSGADAAGDALGLHADRDVVGYSYGSTVVGAASASAEGLAAGTQLHVASPGVMAGPGRELRVDDDGVARGAAGGEVVSARSRWDAVPWWAHTGVLGESAAEAGAREVDVTEPGVPGLDDLTGVHTRYFEPGTVSLSELGRLLAGR